MTRKKKDGGNSSQSNEEWSIPWRPRATLRVGSTKIDSVINRGMVPFLYIVRDLFHSQKHLCVVEH